MASMGSRQLASALVKAAAPAGRQLMIKHLATKQCAVVPGGAAWPAAAVATRGVSTLLNKKVEETLDLRQLLTASRWTKEELDTVSKTHREPADLVDRAAYHSVQALRFNFDVFSFYKVKSMRGRMEEADWIRRIIFLETVAGVPGMVAGMVRHLHSLRLMRRDHGWIHSLLAEAENERMHLLIALQLRRPGPLFRASVIGGQFAFLSFYTLAYLLCPRYCHRFVGYLEEEAVHTYSTLLQEIDAGNLPMFAGLRAPKMARIYYNLPSNALIRDVFECIRADESAHRDTNHHFGDLKADEPNMMVDHLRKGHFQNQNVFSGVVSAVSNQTELTLLSDFQKLDVEGSGFITMECLLQTMEGRGEALSEEEVQAIQKSVDFDGEGRVSYQGFLKWMRA